MSFRRQCASALTGLLWFLIAASPALAAPYSYSNPKPLPAPSGSIVNVSTISQLNNAVQNLQSGQTIVLAAGTYNIASIGEALYLRQNVSNWSIRGATGNRNDVIVQGAGMNGSVRFGFWMMNVSNGTIADLTIRNVRAHGIMMNAPSHHILFHNLRVIDTGDQFLKSNPISTANGNDNGIVEYSVFEYTTTEAGAGETANYTNGVDVHGGDGWIIRYNLFKNIVHAPGQGLAGPSILMWNGSSNTVVDGNTFINCGVGVALGLITRSGFDHQGGRITNNVFYKGAGLASSTDVPIYVADSPGTKVYHNSSIDLSGYPNSIEYRFATTTNVDIRHNLVDRAIVSRNGASGTVTTNITNATAALFTDPAAGDFHLKSSATNAIDKLSVIAESLQDIDDETRPVGAGADYGADEYSTGGTDLTAPSSPVNLRIVP